MAFNRLLQQNRHQAVVEDVRFGAKLPMRSVRCSVAIEGKADIDPVVMNRRE